MTMEVEGNICAVVSLQQTSTNCRWTAAPGRATHMAMDGNSEQKCQEQEITVNQRASTHLSLSRSDIEC